jgi:hypothetical protein
MFVTFTRHAILRMSAAAIARAEIDRILASGDIIERYPDGEPYPSVLMLGWSEARPIHVVAAHNTAEDEIIIITAYRPDSERRDPEFRVRRRRTS